MRTEELIESISERDPLLAKAVSHMVAYVQDRYPSTFPSKEQTMAVNEYLHSVHAVSYTHLTLPPNSLV